MAAGRRRVKSVRYEMACTDRDFERSMPVAFPEAAAEPEARCWHGEGWALQLGEPDERRIAGLALPCLPVEFSFADDRPDHVAAVLHRFWRVFQRGGG